MVLKCESTIHLPFTKSSFIFVINLILSKRSLCMSIFRFRLCSDSAFQACDVSSHLQIISLNLQSTYRSLRQGYKSFDLVSTMACCLLTRVLSILPRKRRLLISIFRCYQGLRHIIAWSIVGRNRVIGLFRTNRVWLFQLSYFQERLTSKVLVPA